MPFFFLQHSGVNIKSKCKVDDHLFPSELFCIPYQVMSDVSSRLEPRQNKSLSSSSSVTLFRSSTVSLRAQSELWSISLTPSLPLPPPFPSASLSPSMLHPPTHLYSENNERKKIASIIGRLSGYERAELTSERQSFFVHIISVTFIQISVPLLASQSGDRRDQTLTASWENNYTFSVFWG